MQKHQLNKMISLVSESFDGKFDKAGMPYVLHCISVMQIVINQFGITDEETLCVAVGHDLVEDIKSITYEQLYDMGFSKNVISNIALLTKVPGQSNREYLDGIKTSKIATVVKMADLTHNMDLKRLKGVEQKDLDRMNKYVTSYHELNVHYKGL